MCQISVKKEQYTISAVFLGGNQLNQKFAEKNDYKMHLPINQTNQNV